MKPVCVPCRRFFRPSQNGKWFIEGMPDGNDAPSGLSAPERWRPYKLWNGDEWRCPDCGSTIIVGVAGRPLAEHYEPDFAEKASPASAPRSRSTTAEAQ